MLYREIIAVCSEIHTKHLNTLCGQNVELLNFQPGATYSKHRALKSQYLCAVMHRSSPSCELSFYKSVGLVSKILVVGDASMYGWLPVTDISTNRNGSVFGIKQSYGIWLLCPNDKLLCDPSTFAIIYQLHSVSHLSRLKSPPPRPPFIFPSIYIYYINIDTAGITSQCVTRCVLNHFYKTRIPINSTKPCGKYMYLGPVK